MVGTGDSPRILGVGMIVVDNKWNFIETIEEYVHETGMPSNFWVGSGWYYGYCDSFLSYEQLSFVLRNRLNAVKEFQPDSFLDQLTYVEQILDSCPALDS